MKKTGSTKKTVPKPASKASPSWIESLPLLYVLLGAVVALIYGKTTGFGFSPMDDRWLIVEKQSFLQDFSNLPALFSQSTLNLYYRPLLNLSLMTDMQIAALSSSAVENSTTVFHMTNILLHLACVMLFFRFMKLLGCTNAIAFFCALLFAVHPLNVQAVAWIPGRNDSLLSLFVLAGTNTLLRYISSKDAKWLALNIVFTIGAFLTKESALMVCAVYAFLIFTYGKELNRSTKIALCSAWFVLALGRWILQGYIVPPNTTSGYPLGEAIPEFISGLIMQAGKFFLPVQQSVFPLVESTSLIPFVVVILIAAFIVWKFGVRNKTLAWLGLTWFAVFILLPEWYSTTSANHEHYEHRMYLPMMGLLLLFSQVKISLSASAVRVSALAVALVFVVMSFRRTEVFRDELTYSSVAVVDAPGISWFHDILGYELQHRNELQLAINCFNEAIKLDSTKAQYFNHRGNTWNALRQYRNAIYDYNHVLRLNPLQGETYISRSVAYYSAGDYDAALLDMRKADSLGVAIRPDFIAALNKALAERDSVSAQ